MHSRYAAPAVILALAALPALASNIYKWTDAQGQTHYSQTPPARGSVQAQSQASVQPGVKLDAPAPPPVAAAAAAPAAAADAAKTAAPETSQAKAKRCTESKERVAFLEERTAYRLMIESKDGTPSRMTEEEFNKRLDAARAAGKGC